MTAAGSPPSCAITVTQLLAGRGPEGVASGQEYRIVLLQQILRKLADGRRLARAVDARQHDHIGTLVAYDQRRFERLQQVGQRIAKKRAGLGGSGFPTLAFPASAQVVE
jgi:hypothetical protein